MSNPNPLIIAPSKPDIEITITYDSKNGDTVLKCNQAVNSLAIAGILSAHVSSIIKSIVAPNIVGGTK